MRKTFELVGGISALLLTVCALILLVFLILKASVAAYSGTKNWLHDFTTTSPEEQAKIDQDNAEWAEDPRNPKVVGQKCIDAGGIPDYSSWDGDVKSCKVPGGESKSVNVEVNQ